MIGPHLSARTPGTCMYLNACTIYPKQPDLAALLAAFDFDIVPITETFWTRMVNFPTRQKPGRQVNHLS